MKKNFLLFILSVFGLSLVSIPMEGNAPFPKGNDSGKKVREITIEDISSREYLSFKLYDFDQFENEFKLNVSGSFGNLTEQNSYTDTLHYHNAFGGIYYDEFIAHHLDNLGRDTMITWTNNEGGSPNYALKKRLSLKYHNDSWRLTGKYTEILGFTDLGLQTSEELIIDTMGNATSFTIKNYDPTSGIVISFTSDSIQFKYDIDGNISEQTNYSYDAFQELMIPKENSVYDWNGDTITSVVVNALNPDGSFNAPNFRIDNISSTKVPAPFERLHEITFGVEPWANAASHRRSEYVNDKWEPEYIQDKITVGNKFIITTSRLDFEEEVPWKRTRENNFHQSLYEKMKYILPRAETETYYKDFAEETYSVDDQIWSPFFETRNTISVGISFGPEANTKSAAEGDSVLTLIKQTYDPGSGEWINNFKQEFVFRNMATSTNDVAENENNITIYPNPGNGYVNVSLKNVNRLSQISIVNAVGQIVFTRRFDNFSGNRLVNADLTHLKKGIYVVRVFSEGNVLSKKLFLQ